MPHMMIMLIMLTNHVEGGSETIVGVEVCE